jgi:putative ABC transport system ATP-binding protein
VAEPIARLEGVSKSYPGRGVLFDDVDLTVTQGESTAILGRSGEGKSTLLSILGLLERPDRGTHRFAGEAVAELGAAATDRLRGGSIGFVFQRFALFSHLSALENVLVPLRHRGGEREATLRDAGRDALTAVGLADAVRRRPRSLSGGEQQRVAIARALVVRPSLILADEPTGSLDEVTGRDVVDLLVDQVQSRGAALVVVTHEQDVARRMDRTLELREGRLHEVTR